MIPAFLNKHAKQASGAEKALRDAGCFDVQVLEGEALANAIRDAIGRGARRIAVAGGDGTISSAAALVAGSHVELAVVRVAGGFAADRWHGHKAIAAAGYGLSAACKIGLLAAGNAWGLLATVMGSSETHLADKPGGVFIRRADVLTPDVLRLLRATARYWARFATSRGREPLRLSAATGAGSDAVLDAIVAHLGAQAMAEEDAPGDWSPL